MSAILTVGRQAEPGKTVSEYEKAAIRKLAYDLASTYCAFEEPNHSTGLHQAIEQRLYVILHAGALDGLDEVHADIGRLRQMPNHSEATLADAVKASGA